MRRAVQLEEEEEEEDMPTTEYLQDLLDTGQKHHTLVSAEPGMAVAAAEEEGAEYSSLRRLGFSRRCFMLACSRRRDHAQTMPPPQMAEPLLHL